MCVIKRIPLIQTQRGMNKQHLCSPGISHFQNQLLRVVHFYLFITLLVTIGTLHSLLCIRIVVDQELQQAVLRWKGAVPLQYGHVTVAKTHIQAA